MDSEHILIIHSDLEIGKLLDRSALRSAGYKTTVLQQFQSADAVLRAGHFDLVILGAAPADGDPFELANHITDRYPWLPIILIAEQRSETFLLKAMRAGIIDCIFTPLRAKDVQQAIRRALSSRQRLKDWSRLETARNTKSLRKQIDHLEALQSISRKVTALLDLDSILKAVVDAAVELTGADAGNILLLDEASGELYMRAARNFQDDFVRTFRIPAEDTLPGQVLKSGKPFLMHQETPKKIKTSYLVSSLLYVPMTVQDRVIGVLGVDNRKSAAPFSDYQVALVSSLADFAAIALQNASLYERTDIERRKLETILTKIQDGVLVLDHDKKIQLFNLQARQTFKLQDNINPDKPIQAVIENIDLLTLVDTENPTQPYRGEISHEDGRVFNAQVTPIPEVGLVVTLHDITHLKELDRIKSEFVNTVSHDLRSPLTAILGYVELISRVGQVNIVQAEFISRIQNNVQHITSLINDLLDLGRIETGFDSAMEQVPLSTLICYAVESLQSSSEEKSQELYTELPDDLPAVFGNPTRLKQMISNLVTNALKYTSVGGKISVQAQALDDQVIIRVCDNGPGIPASDQPYVFDKFYRASNIPKDIPGTGLGLAIVKSIVQNHHGRIWVESVLGQGTVFTIILPVDGNP